MKINKEKKKAWGILCFPRVEIKYDCAEERVSVFVQKEMELQALLLGQ